MLETIVGFVVLGISAFAIWLAVTFYFKSDSLYKEMLKFITEIRTYSVGMYKDTFSMVKEAWPQVWKKGDRETIEKESHEKIKQIREEITNEMKAEVEKIKSLDPGTVKSDEFKKEIDKLYHMLVDSFERTYERIAEVELEREPKPTVQSKTAVPDTGIEAIILAKLPKSEDLGVYAASFVKGIIGEFGVKEKNVFASLANLRKKGLLTYEEPLTPSTPIWRKYPRNE